MDYNPFSLKNKVILVTGASSGIGRAVAMECSKMGANLVINGRNKERLNETARALEDEAQAVIGDLTNEDDVCNLLEQLPRLDGVVLCAGIGETIPLQFASRKKLNKIFETNFFAQIELLRQLQKKKLINHGASVVAISSIGGNYAFNLGNGPYGASKAALSSWMKFAAQELAQKQIRVNCICPGMIHTPLVDDSEVFSEEDMKKYTESIALRRLGLPEEVAWGVVYLLSDASKWVTGTDLIIDGGTILN